MRRVPYDAPLTFKEFINRMFTEHTPCESVRRIWQFEGAYIAGRVMREEDFPLEQTLSAWGFAYLEWQKVRKEVAA